MNSYIVVCDGMGRRWEKKQDVTMQIIKADSLEQVVRILCKENGWKIPKEDEQNPVQWFEDINGDEYSYMIGRIDGDKITNQLM